MMKLSSPKGGCKKKNSKKEKTTNQYLKEIMKNIENLQHTILKKLDKTSRHDDGNTIILTRNRTNSKPLQNNSSNQKGRGNNFNIGQANSKKVSKISSQAKKSTLKSFLICNNDAELLKHTTNLNPEKQYYSSKVNKDKVKTENFTNYYTVRCKETSKSKGKKDHYHSITDRAGDKEDSKCQGKIVSAKQIQLIQHNINKTQNSIQTNNSNIKNEIQIFYKNEINKLQVDQKIKQLQSQLQNCLNNKKVANLSQFHFIRSRMKRISVQINELKQKKYNMKRQLVK